MEKRPKRESKELNENNKFHYQIYILKVYNHTVVKKLKMLAPYLIYAASARFMQTSPNHPYSMLWGSKQLYPQLYHMCIGRVDQTLRIYMHKRLAVGISTAC